MATALSCDLLIKGGHVVDPANGINGVGDVALSGGKVVAVTAPTSGGAAAGTSEGAAGGTTSGDGRGPSGTGSRSLDIRPARVLDAHGCYVIPGVIDLHVHLSSKYGGRVAHGMLARAGVTTALDMGGPAADVIRQAGEHGAGLTAACLEGLAPKVNLSGPDASAVDLRRAAEKGLVDGAIGVKIHFDNALTPEAAGRAIEEANRQGIWVAFHCGTTATASDITGLREAVALAGRNRLHLAHVNSYCRGNVKEPAVEALEAIDLLKSAPHLFSESYLAVINGTSARCVNGEPVLSRVKMWLGMGGFPGTQEGLRQAILAGWARINSVVGDDTVLATGAEGVAAWEAAGTNIGLSFPVNPPIPRLMLATTKDDAGRFVVDALGTDGGGIPRNVLLSAGMQLVQMEMLSVSDLVRKLSWTPSRVIGLAQKGHLSEGADADVTVVEPLSRRARTTIAGGEVVMHEGVVFGRGTTFVTTERGAAAVAATPGCRAKVIDVTRTGFYTGDGLKDAV